MALDFLFRSFVFFLACYLFIVQLDGLVVVCIFFNAVGFPFIQKNKKQKNKTLEEFKRDACDGTW